jgi:hypothetical protein
MIMDREEANVQYDKNFFAKARDTVPLNCKV